ncbi:MAG: hypothetical protein QOG64_836, partial [Acidimicrobiaceae bacterium]|nr:hypothetical protein [Acidimicrobiaceae bacterium]
MDQANICSSTLAAVAVALEEIATRTRPVALAGDERLPVLAPLADLFPGGALRRGTTVTVTGSSSLLLALLAGPSQAGSWAAVVGRPDLGMAAAAEHGVALERLALVPYPGAQWATVASALLDALDVVVLSPPGRMRPGDARRLAAKARERGSVLVPLTGWTEAADVRLAVASSQWQGLGQGHGRLTACRVEVVVSGRGAAARERRIPLWLPSISEVSVENRVFRGF